jgi:DNA polymerase-3 subunit beta
MATDLELGIRLEVRGVKVEETGEALLQTNRIISILREATDEEMSVEAGPESCLIKGKTAEFEMPGEDAGAFPDVPAFAEETYHEVTAGVMRDMIRKTIFAPAAAEHTRYGATTGILVELEGDHASLVATDGRRLAQVKGPAQAKGGHSTKGQMPVVPTKALGLLERNLSEPEELVRIAIRPNEALFKTERAMIYTRLVEGRYPNYKQVIPQKNPNKISLIAGPFFAAVRQAAIMTDEESKRVVFQFSKKKLTLQARGAEAGRSHVELPIEYDGKPAEISFDPKFLADMLKVLEPDTAMILELGDSGAPGLFRIGTDYLYVVVPLVAVREGSS